jgi:capsular polysaccharide transport system permease protein
MPTDLMSEATNRFLPPYRNASPAPASAEFWAPLRTFIADVRVQFAGLVAAPTLLACIYYGLIAAPQFVSHTEYIVRGVDAHRSSGLAALLNTFGLSRAADEMSAIESFLKSREVLEKLNARVDLRTIYGVASADALSRFPRIWERDTFEDLYAYTRDYISVVKDPATGVTKLEIAAFDAKAAESVATVMLGLASEMANNLNTKAQADTVDASQRELEEARDNVVQIQTDLTAFRNEALLVDPLAFAGAMLEEIGSLSLEKARTQAQISEAERLSPNNPALGGLKASAEALSQKVEEERGKLAGDSSALAGKVAKYERLTLLRELAEKRYASALLSLQTAESEAQRKRIYIEEIVTPNLPDEATRPERLRSIVTVFVVGFIAFAILWILSVGSKDHAQ